jgi:hypothetical protein
MPESPMVARPLLVLTALLAFGAAASAADLPNLPSLAVDPQVESPWQHGLYVGSEVSFTAAKGVKGMAGGAGYMGYNREFTNGVVLGIQASAGYAPFAIQNSRFRGADFVGATASVGYDMGRLTPFLMTSVDFARSSQFEHGFSGGTDAINNFLNGGGNTSTFGSVGAGFNYAITNNLSVGMAVNVGTARGYWP